MPVLLNSRHERFAQLLAGGKSQRNAYLAAGYRCSLEAADSSASDLLRNPKIFHRVVEIKGKGAERAEVTVQSLIAEAEEVRRLAMANKQCSAAVSAIREKGILSGNRIKRSEHSQSSEFEHMSDAELTAAVVEQTIELMKEPQFAAMVAKALARIDVNLGSFSEESSTAH
jgi:phage terminase small subunit